MFICRQLISSRTDQYIPTPDDNGEFRFYAVRRPGTKGFVKTAAMGEETHESNTYRTRFGKDRRMGTLVELEDSTLWLEK